MLGAIEAKELAECTMFDDINIELAGTYTLDATASYATDATSASFVIAPAAAAQFVIVDPTDGTVDAAITVTVEAQDQYGNVVTTYTDDVTLAAGGDATGGGVVDIAAGVGTLDISDETPETVALSLTDSASTGLTVSSTQDVVFAAGAATEFVILDPTDGTTGTPITVTVQAQDQFGNVATAEDRDVTLVADGDATGGGLVAIVAGVGTLDISDSTAETVNLSLSDSESTSLTVSSTQDVVFN